MYTHSHKLMYLFKMCAGVLEPRILSVERDGGVVYSWRVSLALVTCVTLFEKSCARRSIHSSANDARGDNLSPVKRALRAILCIQ